MPLDRYNSITSEKNFATKYAIPKIIFNKLTVNIIGGKVKKKRFELIEMCSV